MTQDASLSPLGSNVSNPHRWGGKSENGPRGDIPPRLRRPPPSAAAAELCTTLPPRVTAMPSLHTKSPNSTACLPVFTFHFYYY